MTALSINVNKFALIRNARGADMPNLVDISKKCIEYGADGITVHPRPDERHVKFSDLEEGFSSEFQSSMNTDFTEDVFPDTRIEPKDAFEINEDDVPF